MAKHKQAIPRIAVITFNEQSCARSGPSTMICEDDVPEYMHDKIPQYNIRSYT